MYEKVRKKTKNALVETTRVSGFNLKLDFH